MASLLRRSLWEHSNHGFLTAPPKSRVGHRKSSESVERLRSCQTIPRVSISPNSGGYVGQTESSCLGQKPLCSLTKLICKDLQPRLGKQTSIEYGSLAYKFNPGQWHCCVAIDPIYRRKRIDYVIDHCISTNNRLTSSPTSDLFTIPFPSACQLAPFVTVGHSISTLLGVPDNLTSTRPS